MARRPETLPLRGSITKHPFDGMDGMGLCDQSTSKTRTITFFAPFGGTEMAQKKTSISHRYWTNGYNRITVIDCLNLMNLMGHWNGYHTAVAAPILSVRKPVEKMPRASRQTNDSMHVMKFCTSRDCECPKCGVFSMVEK